MDPLLFVFISESLARLAITQCWDEFYNVYDDVFQFVVIRGSKVSANWVSDSWGGNIAKVFGKSLFDSILGLATY